MALNRVVLQGNLIQDPEIRETSGGRKVCNMVLAVDRQGKTRNNEDTPPHIVELEAWERQGELCKQYLSKGSPLLVEGRLWQDRWEEPDTHKRCTKIIVKVDNAEFLPDSRKDKLTLQDLEKVMEKVKDDILSRQHDTRAAKHVEDNDNGFEFPCTVNHNY